MNARTTPARARRCAPERAAPGRALLARMAGAAVLACVLGACVPAADDAGDAPAAAEPVLAATSVELEARPGDAAHGLLPLWNRADRAVVVEVRATEPFIELEGQRRFELPAGASRDVAFAARCGPEDAVHRGWVLVESAGLEEAFDVRLVCREG